MAATAVAVFLTLRHTPENGVSAEGIHATATRLAPQGNAASIAEVLQRDDSYIRSLDHVVRTQHSLVFRIIFFFAVIAALNLICMFNTSNCKTRDTKHAQPETDAADRDY